MDTSPVIAIHAGGCGLYRHERDAALDRECCLVLKTALEKGYSVLENHGNAIDAVELSVSILEDFKEFNAGCGSALTIDGKVEMDAVIIDGRSLRAGAVGALRNIKNPISVAKTVMEKSIHTFLVGEGAFNFALKNGFDFYDEKNLITEKRILKLEYLKRKIKQSVDDNKGTVGSVARDKNGNLAAATSTGGMNGQLPGRVGDSPIVGAGTLADNSTCAISGQGDGEKFLCRGFAHQVDALIRHCNLSLQEACEAVLNDFLKLEIEGGCIAVAKYGEPVIKMNCDGMFRGVIRSDGLVRVGIYNDDLV